MSAEAKQAQREFCEQRNLPNFAGGGDCHGCKRNIYDAISVERASTELITGCPYCRKSFVE